MLSCYDDHKKMTTAFCPHCGDSLKYGIADLRKHLLKNAERFEAMAKKAAARDDTSRTHGNRKPHHQTVPLHERAKKWRGWLEALDDLITKVDTTEE